MPAGHGRLTLLLPGLAPGVDPHEGSPGPALRRLLARADWSPQPQSTTTALLDAFGLPADCALASLLAQADLGATEPGWLCADPVHFRADAKLVMLIAPDADELDAADADALLAELAARLPEFTWRRGRSCRRWYVRMPDLTATPTLGPAWLHGRSLTPFFPQAPAYRRWRQAMTEAQMVMHAAEVNARREARGATPLNALWIWGGGRVVPPTSAGVALAVGEDLLLAGAAAATGSAHRVAPERAPLAEALGRGAAVLVAGAPYGSLHEPAAGVVAAGEGWALAAWAALAAGEANVIDLVGERVRGVLTRTSRWRVWRRTPAAAVGDPHAVLFHEG